jgi:transcription elongation GreA/GreB family factor
MPPFEETWNMALPETLISKGPEALEEWFLEALEGGSLPLYDMLQALHLMADAGDAARLSDCAEMLQDRLVESGDQAGSLTLLRIRCAWQEVGAVLAVACESTARALFKDRLGKAFVANVGFGEIPPAESLRRLETLLSLKRGALCYDGTWGFGIVQSVDDFYKKVKIDFTSKPGHQMSFAYAGETLDLLDDDHLLARRHRDPDGLKRMVVEDPAEVVRITIRSFGPLSAPLLKERLVDDVLCEAEWKAFWDGARRRLKTDPLVELPARRNDPICLLDHEKEYDEAWFAALAKTRDVGEILSLLGELEQEQELASLPEPSKQTIDERLAFVVIGTESGAPAVAARAVLAAARLGFEGGRLDVAGVTERLLGSGAFLTALAELPAREVAPFLTHLERHDAEGTASRLVSLLPGMRLSVLTTAAEYLLSRDARAACLDVFRDRFGSREAGPAMLYWCCRHLDVMYSEALTTPAELLAQVVDCLAVTFSADALKAQNQLQGLFSQQEWFGTASSMLSDQEQKALFLKIKHMRGWEVAEQRSAMARLIRLYPGLEQLVAGARESEADEDAPRGRFTSYRTHRERREQLRNIVEVEIPENSREIGVARSYGDLRENAEYKFAREHQGLLMRRKAELESDLTQVNATDFRAFSTDAVGMGTRVTLARADGTETTVTILGEWDRDESLGIIASASRLAEALDGRVVGDEVTVPGLEGEETCRITAIARLSDAVKTWISGQDA